ncbi:MAG: hypothetical protein LQ349_006748 [Xanthoria aureola]|nr:MAG: hypothetical protein LQ349_006748 [Xanthoria aureola]
MPSVTTANAHPNKSSIPPHGPDIRWFEPVMVLIAFPIILILGYKLKPMLELYFHIGLCSLQRKWRRLDSYLGLTSKWRSLKTSSRTLWPWITTALVSVTHYRRNRGYMDSRRPNIRSWMDGVDNNNNDDEEHELQSLGEHMDGAADDDARRCSGETAVSAEPVERQREADGMETESIPQSMDITALPPVTEEIRRELSAEAKENVDIVNRGVVSARDRYRPGYEPQTSEG